MDGDGHPDVVFGGTKGCYVLWNEPNTDGGRALLFASGLPSEQPSTFVLADGGTDVFPGTRNSQVGAVALGNVFGNGRVDIVIGHQTYNGGPPELVENTGNRGFGSVVKLDPPGWDINVNAIALLAPPAPPPAPLDCGSFSPCEDGECTDAPPNLNPPDPSERNVCVGKSGCVEMPGGYGYWLCCSPSEDGTPCLRPNKPYDNPCAAPRRATCGTRPNTQVTLARLSR